MCMKHKIYDLICCLFLCVIMLIPSVNVYANDAGTKSVTAHIPVVCVCKNAKDADEDFIYTLKPASTKYQIVNTTELKLSGGKDGFFDVTYTYPGTYRYTVSQEAGKDSDITYDTVVYDAVVYVTEDSTGKLAAEVVAYKSGSNEKADKIVFNNYHKISSSTSNSGNVSASMTQNAPNVQTSDAGTLLFYVAGIVISVLIVMLIFKQMFKRKKERDE